MKILFQIRNDYLSNVAGDSIVFQNIINYLRQLGVQVDVCTDININLSSYDIVHIFNAVRVYESVQFIKNAKEYKKKIVLSPIYWDLKEYFDRTKQHEKLNRWCHAEQRRRFIFDNCDIFLPHCKGEADLIINNYNTSTPFEIVPFGVEPSFSYGEKHYLAAKYGIDNYILCVGRMNEQKNQLTLIKALSKEKLPLVFVGSINDIKYYKECIKIARNNLIVLDKAERSELKSIYKSAKVHILPSWLEYPGLASLEAGVAGCNIVSTGIGSTKEVFKDFVGYCNPYSQESVYKETMEAFERKQNNDFKDFILENYTWLKAAARIKNIYHSLKEG